MVPIGRGAPRERFARRPAVSRERTKIMAATASRRTRSKISPQRLAANRANAMKSTGPRTDEGKAASRLNAMKHGLCALVVPVPGEDQARQDRIRDAWADALRPADVAE